MSDLIDITDKEFLLISDLVYSKFGINLTDKKRTLVRGRLNKLIRDMGFTTFEEYYDFVIQDATGKGLVDLVDKISTNHTFFFRENDHFMFLKERVLPQISQVLRESGSRDVRIWCAGCASGEEAYTLAIILSEYFGKNYFNDGPPILATDISVTALNQALLGIYPWERVKTIPASLILSYFKKIGDASYQVSTELKELVIFKRLNFKLDRFPFKGKFHAIFCRNVMIYFDKPTKDQLVDKFYKHLHENGFLFIGHSETLGRDLSGYQYVQPAVYRKR